MKIAAAGCGGAACSIRRAVSLILLIIILIVFSVGKKRNPYSEDRLAKLRVAQPVKRGDTRSSKSTKKQSATMKLKEERRVKTMMWHDCALMA